MTPVVFLSRPSALSGAQAQVFDRWLLSFTERGFQTKRLLRSEYRDDPWSQLRELLMESDGAVVFGFKQRICRRCAQSRFNSGSSWMQIEAGMAIMIGLPVLATPEDGVRDGVFAPTTWHGSLSGVSVDSDPSHDVVDGWAEAVTVQFGNRTRGPLLAFHTTQTEPASLAQRHNLAPGHASAPG